MIAGGYSLPDRKGISRLLLAGIVIFAANLWADSGANHRGAAVSIHIPPIIFVQAPRITSVTGAERFPEGSRIVLLTADANDKSPHILTGEFFAAADPQIDFAGQRVVFAGQKARGDRWQIWEMNLDGSSPRQITKCEADCVRPAYLPADEIAFTSEAVNAGHRRSALEVIGLDGSNVHAITFGPGDWWLETVLRDGRIVASANAPLTEAERASANRLLYTLRPDGTGLESLRCEHSVKATRGEARELEDGSIIFTENGSALMAVRRGALHEENVGLPGNFYRSPNALQGDAIVVARKTALAQRYELSVISRDGSGKARTVYSDGKFDSVEPVAVVTRPVPKKFWSNLIPSSPTGYFISLDSSNSMDKAESPAPVRRARVIQQRNSGDAVLGEATVEPDGSFYVQVPANEAVRFVLLDEQGRVIREEQSWIWTRPGEQRGCTGCHGDKALAPENRWPMALKRQEPPTNLSGATSGGQALESHGH
jgi:hypothetical protein